MHTQTLKSSWIHFWGPVIAVVSACFYLVSFVPLMFSRCPIAAVEFELTSFALLGARLGLEAYQPLSSGFTAVGYYGPLFYLLPAGLGAWLGWASDVHRFLLGTRFLSFAFTLLGSAVLVRLLARLSGSVSFAGLSVFVLISRPWFIEGFRPDFAALLFIWTACWLVVTQKGSERLRDFLAGLLCAAAVLHLQRMGAFVLAYGAYLLVVEKSVRRCLLFLLTFAVSALLPLLALFFLAGGSFFEHAFKFLSLVSTARDDYFIYFWSKPGRLLHMLIFFSWVCFFLAGKKHGSTAAFLRFYFLSTFLICAITTRSVGAASNHFLEPIGAGLMLLAWVSGRRFPVKIAAFCVLSVFMLKDTMMQWHAYQRPAYFGGLHSACEDEEAFSSLPEGPMLSDFSVIPYKAGKPEASTKSSDWMQILELKAMVDPEITLERIRTQYYASIVLTDQSPAFLDVFGEDIRANYRKSFQIGSADVWVPRADHT